MEKNDKAYLGTGWAFPPGFVKGVGVEMVSEEEDIRQSLGILFSTRPGERIMRFDYGCNISGWAFSSMTLSERTMLKDAIKYAALYYEPRIKIISLDVEIRDPLEGILWINIEYRVLQTNNRNNIVYPFYYREGTNI